VYTFRLKQVAILPIFFQLVVALFLLVLPAQVLGKKALTIAQGKVHYTLEAIKHIAWPNEQQMQAFDVALVGLDRETKAAFEQIDSNIIRGKAIRLVYLTKQDPTSDQYAVIFLAASALNINPHVFNNTIKALIITDGLVEDTVRLVSLNSLPSRNRIELKLNRKNLAFRGFEVSVNLLDFAGSREDLMDQLRDNKASLEELMIQVEQRQLVLNKLNSELSQNTQQLILAQKSLSENEKIIQKNSILRDALLVQIRNAQLQLQKDREEAQHQNEQILRKQGEIERKEQQVSHLHGEIEENQAILDKQLSSLIVQQHKLAQQQKMIKYKDQTIGLQRNWIVISILLSVLFLVMIYFLYKANDLRKASNKKLALLNSQLYELATTDGLTKLFNRRHFLSSAQIELIRQKRHKPHSAVLMLDIDHFKKVNDNYGHAAGDEVLKAVANILAKNMREYDLLGRIGGEEFAMILVECNLAQGTEVAHRLCKQIQALEVNTSHGNVNVTISIGLSSLEKNDVEVEQSLSRADIALYQAKENGRNQFVVYS
jgi:diguanylate cyclase (GGDEF)-like protein